MEGSYPQHPTGYVCQVCEDIAVVDMDDGGNDGYCDNCYADRSMKRRKMPNWIQPVWQCPHCDFKAKNFDELMEHASEVGLPFFDALVQRR
jgi:hypothetical protein